jgi:hypothetical protein
MAFVAFCVRADEPSASQDVPDVTPELIAKLQALEAKTKHVWIRDFKGDVSEFVADADPMTVQHVVVSSDKLAAPRTSSDGQVIFLRKEDVNMKTEDALTLAIGSGLRRLLAAKAADGA